MTLFRGRAPVEASADERAIGLPAEGPHSCVACGDTGRVHQIPLGDFGKQWVCVQPKPCRERAQAKGIWKKS